MRNFAVGVCCPALSSFFGGIISDAEHREQDYTQWCIQTEGTSTHRRAGGRTIYRQKYKLCSASDEKAAARRDPVAPVVVNASQREREYHP